MSDLTGQRLGQYQILARISKGSTSTIYKAYQPKLDRFVAIKVLSPQIVDEENFIDRFTQEARAVAQLDHPNIVPVYDFDRVGDIAYIVFKYVESGTLRNMIKGHPMDLPLAVDLATQVGLALGYAHKRGVVHRDVKPTNVLVAEGHWALLTDFGLAKILGGGRQLTQSGIGLGTPDYMSPEQAQGLPGDGRADLYSLGVMFYEMITGHLPFEADSSMGVVVKHITEPPPPPSCFNAGLPAPLEREVLKSLAKDPERRFQTAEAMVAALVRAASPAAGQRALPNLDIPALAATGTAERRVAAGAPTAARGKRREAKRNGWAGISWSPRIVLAGPIVVGLALLLLSGILAVWAGQQPTRAPAQSPVARTGSGPAGPPASPTPARRRETATASPPAASASGPAATPSLILLPNSAKIRPGIYVKIVKPGGANLFEEAGFDKTFITNLPISSGPLYVIEGPVPANSLSWIRVSDGNTVGWMVQDDVAAYAIRSVP